KNLLKNYALNKLIANENVTEEEIKEYYEENKEQYKKEESVKAKHILVDTEEKAKERSEERRVGKKVEKGRGRISKEKKRNREEKFFFTRRSRHTRSKRDWSSDVCSSDLRIY